MTDPAEGETYKELLDFIGSAANISVGKDKLTRLKACRAISAALSGQFAAYLLALDGVPISVAAEEAANLHAQIARAIKRKLVKVADEYGIELVGDDDE